MARTGRQNAHPESILTDFKLFRGQVLPRWKLIICSWHVKASLALSILMTLLIPHLPFSILKVNEVATIGLSFSSISLGGCFTACVLALALPGEERIQKWPRAKGEIKRSSDYSDLIFVLVWSSLAQFSLIITCVVALLAGGTNMVYPPAAPFYQYLSIGTAALIFNYAALELLTVINTLMRVGIVIMLEESLDGSNNISSTK